MDVTDSILNFRALLVVGYANWHTSAQAALMRDNGFLDESFSDWAQANWELLVERAICGPNQYLVIYGAGSDYEMQVHSRVFFREGKPTHEIRCELLDGASAIDVISLTEIQRTSYAFDRFVALDANWHADEPPFDYVLLDAGDSQHMLPVNAVRFVLHQIGAA